MIHVDLLTEVPDLLQQIVLGIAIGGFIGLERELDGQQDTNKFAGMRTLALLCGTGPVMVFYAELVGFPWLSSLYIILGLTLAIGIAYIRFKLDGEDMGFTTSTAVFLVTLLGLLVGYNQYFEAISVSIITGLLLAEKQSMREYTSNLTYEELTDSIQLGILVFILYPILPSEPIDPYGVLVFQDILLFAIFVLLIEFAAYLSMRQFGGSHGLLITGLLAGMANSFATAGVMARMANRSPKALDSASSGIMLSIISMIIRNAGIASILAISMFWVIWLPIGIMLGLAVIVTVWLLWTGKTYEEFDLDFDSPFSFKTATKFSAIYIIITVVSIIANEQFSEFGLLATAYLGGLGSSAAVSISAATLVNSGTNTVVGGGMVILGIIGSLTSKLVLVEVINGDMRVKALLPIGIIGVVGFISYFVI